MEHSTSPARGTDRCLEVRRKPGLGREEGGRGEGEDVQGDPRKVSGPRKSVAPFRDLKKILRKGKKREKPRLLPSTFPSEKTEDLVRTRGDI